MINSSITISIKVLSIIGYVPYGAGTKNAVITGNYFMNDRIQLQSPYSGMAFTGNKIWYTTLDGLTQSTFPSNTWYGNSKPFFRRVGDYQAE